MAMLKVELGNIVRFQIDAIVNAANEFMLGGGGVDGAIHRAAGPRLLEACRAVPEVRPGVRCPVGEARITGGFDLPARYVIHTVGPVWRDGHSGEDDALASCYRASLELAGQHGVQSIAFPAVSCGIFRFPVARACAIAVREIRQHFSRPTSISTVILVAFDATMHEALRVATGDGPEDG